MAEAFRVLLTCASFSEAFPQHIFNGGPPSPLSRDFLIRAQNGASGSESEGLLGKVDAFRRDQTL